MVKLFSFEKKAGKQEVKDEEGGGFFSDLFKREGQKNAEKVQAEKKGDRVILKGRVPKKEDAERMIVSAGNTKGVAEVESQIEVEEPAENAKPDYTMYTVKSGDTLSKIAKAHYGDAMAYDIIFEANKPMLKDPDEIYPGQVLRVPPKDDAIA
ncbi:peptidoglycan-binding protein LysM [Parvularcula dongshanensis]|uniref:Potassium binding protein Kbp n=1 Tax=Parvularcula dongshanensis TaxID=1173995 RepID=A0A840I363_9PROT|nr:peptidoglycan-binding protein LysM [Parvularcula dongshanensis]MBB4658721.1 nucleoid-associated protein YgaU [Parvularcula dongshanensis]